MRDSLEKLISSAIVFEYSLPHGAIPKVTVANVPDHCYRNQTSSDDIKELIYNGLIDYGIEVSRIDISRLQPLHKLVLTTKLRYDENATLDSKIKYGFYGEVLLYLLIQYFYGASTLISRGYFYNPLERSETKGYDTYQIRYKEKDFDIELWFGEVKFYGNYSEAVKKIFKNIDKALSDDYLSLNFKAFVNHVEKFDPNSIPGQIVQQIIDNPDVVISDLIRQNNMTLMYPALLICDDKDMPYDDIIKEIVDHINEKYTVIHPTLSIPYQFFFVILPVHDSMAIKTDVIKWISSNHPLI